MFQNFTPGDPLKVVCTCAGVTDIAKDKGAVVGLVYDLYDTEEKIVARCTRTLLLRDIGGFGSKEPPFINYIPIPKRSPDHIAESPTYQN